MPSERDKAKQWQFAIAVALLLIAALPAVACGWLAEYLENEVIYWTEERIALVMIGFAVYLLSIPAPFFIWAPVFCRSLDRKQLTVSSLLALTLATSISLALLLWLARKFMEGTLTQ